MLRFLLIFFCLFFSASNAYALSCADSHRYIIGECSVDECSVGILVFIDVDLHRACDVSYRIEQASPASLKVLYDHIGHTDQGRSGVYQVRQHHIVECYSSLRQDRWVPAYRRATYTAYSTLNEAKTYWGKKAIYETVIDIAWRILDVMFFVLCGFVLVKKCFDFRKKYFLKEQGIRNPFVLQMVVFLCSVLITFTNLVLVIWSLSFIISIVTFILLLGQVIILLCLKCVRIYATTQTSDRR